MEVSAGDWAEESTEPYCSLIDSSSETADHSVTLAKEGMFGSCATSSSRLIALAALTARLCFGSWSIKIESLTIFRMFLGVMFESAICWSVVVALASFASFSCCFLILVLVVLITVVVPSFLASFRRDMCFSVVGTKLIWF